MSESAHSYPLLRFFSRLGARLGHSGSMVLLGAIHEADGGSAENIRRANELYRAAAAKGNAQAMWSLGVNFLSSKGGETDHDQAVAWIGRAAEAGHGMAAWAMGKMHLAGRLVDKDVERGLLLLQRSAAAGFRDAGVLLAEIYRQGDYGVTVDEAEAQRWLDLTLPLAERLRLRLGRGTREAS